MDASADGKPVTCEVMVKGGVPVEILTPPHGEAAIKSHGHPIPDDNRLSPTGECALQNAIVRLVLNHVESVGQQFECRSVVARVVMRERHARGGLGKLKWILDCFE